MLPPLLYFFAILFLTSCMVSAIWVAIDLRMYPPKMRVMRWVWPLTMLYLGPPALGFYYLYGRNKPARGRWLRRQHTPFWAQALKSAFHCGAGCALGAFIGEWVVYLTGFSLFGSVLWGKFTTCFILAYLLGLLFQFFAMPPKRKRDTGKTLWRAVKSDTLSLTAYEVGMFVWMAVINSIYPDIEPTSWDYWYLMQVAMIMGLTTTYPVNRWLLKKGIKQAM